MKAEDFVAINLGTECKGLGIANASSLIKNCLYVEKEQEIAILKEQKAALAKNKWQRQPTSCKTSGNTHQESWRGNGIKD